MIDKNITRFCQLVNQINELTIRLEKEKDSYYDGGYSFEEVNSGLIKDIVDLQNELKTLIVIIK